MRMDPPRPIIVVRLLCDVAQYRDLVASDRAENTQNSSPSGQIHNELDLQWKSYEAWANRMRPFINLDDLPEFVSPKDLETLRRLRRYYRDYSHTYRAYDMERLLRDLIAAKNALETLGKLAFERIATNMSLSQKSIRPSYIPPLRTVYRTTLKILQDISVRRCDPKVTRSASRLKLWGAALFEVDISLDTVFDSNRDAFRPVRQSFLRTLVDILLWEGRL